MANTATEQIPFDINQFDDDDDINPGVVLENTINENPIMKVDAKNMLEVMKCPVCYNVYDGTVYQCSSGHNFCYNCNTQMSICPVCRDPLNKQKPIRNLAIEQILGAMNIEVPCKHMSKGCTTKVNFAKFQNHTSTCKFAPKLCGLDSCKSEVGTNEQYIAHLMTSHANMAVIDNEFVNSQYLELRMSDIVHIIKHQYQVIYTHSLNNNIIFIMFEMEQSEHIRIQAFSYNSMPYIIKMVLFNKNLFRTEEYEVLVIPFDDFKKIYTNYAQNYKKGHLIPYYNLIQSDYINYCITLPRSRFTEYSRNPTQVISFSIRELYHDEMLRFTKLNSGEVTHTNNNDTLTAEQISDILGEKVDENGYCYENPIKINKSFKKKVKSNHEEVEGE